MHKTAFVLAVCLGMGSARAQERWSFLGGDPIGEGKTALSAEAGWPDLTLGWTKGLGPGSDIGARLELAFGYEGTTGTQLGFGFRVPIRFSLLRGERVSVLFTVAPGVKLYTTDPVLFGAQVPVGVVLGYQAMPKLIVGFGADMGFLLAFAGPGAAFAILSPVFGPMVEYHLDDKIAIGLNTRFGAAIGIGGPGTAFALRSQIYAAYRF